MGIRLSILMAVLSGSLHAAVVLRVGRDMTNIAVTHDESRTWSPRDRVCILQRAREVGCGVVVKTTSKGAIVKLDAPNNDIIAGDKVISKFQAPVAGTQAPPPQQSAPLMNSVADSGESEIHTFNLSGGVGVGTSFFYPTLSGQVAVSPTLAIGLTGHFFTYTSFPNTLTAFGGFATLNYYSQEYFRGLWIQGGAGMTYFTVSSIYGTESATSITGIATVGWRGYWDLGINIGLGGGFSYTTIPLFTTINVNSAGFQPVLILDVGISF